MDSDCSIHGVSRNYCDKETARKAYFNSVSILLFFIGNHLSLLVSGLKGHSNEQLLIDLCQITGCSKLLGCLFGYM